MTESLSIGYPHTVLQNVVYALPSRICRVQSLAAVEVSVDNSNWTALTGANTVGADTSAVWVRCTTGNTVITVKTL